MKRITGTRVAAWIITVAIFVIPFLVLEYVPEQWHDLLGFGGLALGVAVVIGIHRYEKTRPELTMDQQSDLDTIRMVFTLLGIASFVLVLFLFA